MKVFWFFFSKKNKHFFLKKEAKTFIHLERGLMMGRVRARNQDMTVNRDSIATAAARIGPYVRRTPVLEVLEGELGQAFTMVLKLELLSTPAASSRAGRSTASCRRGWPANCRQPG